MPKILWMSPYSLHDISSGASIHCKTVLECLAKRGFEVWSCSSFIFDSPAGASVFNNLKDKIDSSKKSVFEIDDAGIHYIYTRSSSNFEQEQKWGAAAAAAATLSLPLQPQQPTISNC